MELLDLGVRIRKKAAIASFPLVFPRRDNEFGYKRNITTSTTGRFSAALVNRHLEFDGIRILRMLVRAGFLEAVPGEGEGAEGVWFRRGAGWPVPAGYLEGTPIGVAYYVQKWFRFNLQQWITSRMRELESNEGVYSLEGWQDFQKYLIY